MKDKVVLANQIAIMEALFMILNALSEENGMTFPAEKKLLRERIHNTLVILLPHKSDRR